MSIVKQPMRTLSLVCLTLASSLSWSLAHAQEGTWPAFHQNARQQGRATAPGDITEPAVRWTGTTGGVLGDTRTLWGDVNQDGSPELMTLVGGVLLVKDQEDRLLWDTPPLELNNLVAITDLDGDGRPEVLARGAALNAFDGSTGALLWRLEGPGGAPLPTGNTFVVQAEPDQAPELLITQVREGNLSLWDFGAGFDAARQVWSATREDYPTQVMRPVIGDFDGDGQAMEIAIVNQANCQIVFTALDTGNWIATTEALSESRFCYGLTQAANVDQDNQDELIFTGEGQSTTGQAGVTVYDLVREELQWQWVYEGGFAVRVEPPPGAVGDLDGDGDQEIVYAVRNNTTELAGDDGVMIPDKWATLILDAATGQLESFIEGAQVIALQDLDGDGTPEITGLIYPQDGSVPQQAIWRVKPDQGPTLLWSLPAGEQVFDALRGDNTINTRDSVLRFAQSAPGASDILMLRRQDDQTSIARYVLSGDDVTLDAESPVEPGLTLSVQGHLEGNTPAVALRTDLGQVRVLNQELESLYSLSFTGHSAAVVASEGHLFYMDSSRSLNALSWASRSVELDLRRNSRSQAAPLFFALDTDGDGSSEVAQVVADENGQHALELLGGQGELLWSSPFPMEAQVPTIFTHGDFADSPGLEIAYWQTNFDLTRTLTLLGADNGEILGQIQANEAEVNPTPGRELLPAPDQTGDGLDEIVALHNTTLEILSGADLTRLGDVVPYPAQTSNPLYSTIFQDAQGEASLFLNLFTSRHGLLSLDPVAEVWAVDQEPSLLRLRRRNPGLTDITGDGVLDLVMPGRFNNLTILNGASGEVAQRICLDEGDTRLLTGPADANNCQSSSLSSVVVADIDDDGDEDILVGSADGWIYALDATTGDSLWSYFARFQVSNLILADIDRDQHVEVVATVANSRLVILDGQALDSVAQVRDVNLDLDGQILAPGVDVDVVFGVESFAAAWDAVPEATSYEVTLLSPNFNPLRAPVQTQDTTYIFENLALIPGSTYYVQVVAQNAEGTAAASLSDGALVALAGPMITGLQARPNPFDPGRGQVAQIQGTMVASSGLQNITMSITPLDEFETTPLLEEDIALDGELLYELRDDWDGGGAPDGLYLLQVVAFDQLGAATSDSLILEILTVTVDPDMGGDMDMGGDQDMGGADMGIEADMAVDTVTRGSGCCNCTTSPGRLTDWFGPLMLALLAACLVWRKRKV